MLSGCLIQSQYNPLPFHKHSWSLSPERQKRANSGKYQPTIVGRNRQTTGTVSQHPALISYVTGRPGHHRGEKIYKNTLRPLYHPQGSGFSKRFHQSACRSHFSERCVEIRSGWQCDFSNGERDCDHSPSPHHRSVIW